MESPKQNRRDFISSASKILGSAALISPFSIIHSSSCASPPDEKLGVALVGLGTYSTTMLSRALQETTNCYLAGIVTGTPAKAEQWAERYNIKESNIYNYDNFDDIANNDEIDIIYIVLPNGLHSEYTIRALEAGKHVICEKPMALTAAEAQKMIDVSKKTGKKLSLGYRMHFDPYFIEVKRLAQNEVFGPINYMEAGLGYSFSPQIGSWKLKKSMGGGELYNLGVYPIQGARHAKGSEPIYLTAQAKTKRKSIFVEVDEMFTWQLEWADGTICSSYTGPNARLDRLYVGCANGWINNEPAYNYSGQAVTTSTGRLDYEQVFQQKLQIDDFGRCIKEDDQTIVPGEEGRRDLLIIDAIHESIKTGQRVKIGQ